MARSIQKNQQMRDASRSGVLLSAMKLFAENGYTVTTTRAIAKDAGISTGLMYHYYTGKEGLLRAVFENSMAILSDSFAGAITNSGPDSRLSNLLKTIFSMLETDKSFWSLFYMLRTQPAIMRVLGDDFRVWTRRLRDIFESELEQNGREDPQIEALMLYSLVEGTIQQYLLDPEHYPLNEVKARIIFDYC